MLAFKYCIFLEHSLYTACAICLLVLMSFTFSRSVLEWNWKMVLLSLHTAGRRTSIMDNSADLFTVRAWSAAFALVFCFQYQILTAALYVSATLLHPLHSICAC